MKVETASRPISELRRLLEWAENASDQQAVEELRAELSRAADTANEEQGAHRGGA